MVTRTGRAKIVDFGPDARGGIHHRGREQTRQPNRCETLTEQGLVSPAPCRI